MSLKQNEGNGKKLKNSLEAKKNTPILKAGFAVSLATTGAVGALLMTDAARSNDKARFVEADNTIKVTGQAHKNITDGVSGARFDLNEQSKSMLKEQIHITLTNAVREIDLSPTLTKGQKLDFTAKLKKLSDEAFIGYRGPAGQPISMDRSNTPSPTNDVILPIDAQNATRKTLNQMTYNAVGEKFDALADEANNSDLINKLFAGTAAGAATSLLLAALAKAKGEY